MVSPFRRHQLLVNGIASGLAAAPDAEQAPAEPAADTAEGQEYAALRVLLLDNLRQLSDVARRVIPLRLSSPKPSRRGSKGCLSPASRAMRRRMRSLSRT
jgi:hypothetical protein